MKHEIFTGSAPALITPFRNGVIDYDTLDLLLERQIEGGSSAVVLAGTTGESAALEYDEHRQLLRHAATVIDGRIPLIAGAGSNSTLHARRLIEQAEDAGADALLLVTPYYNKTSQAGLIRHYTLLADHCSLPILLYHVPSRTGMTILPETLGILSQHPLIYGIKEAGTDFDAICRAMSLCAPDFSFYSGNDSLTLPMMALGAKGVISVAANLVPEAMQQLCAACLQGDYAAAGKLHRYWLGLMQVLFTDVNPIPVKSALHMLGLCSPELRLPLISMDSGKQEVLKVQLLRCGLL